MKLICRNLLNATEPHEARAPTGDELQALLAKIITRILKCLTRQGALVEAEGVTYLGEIEADHALTALQAASCTLLSEGPTTACGSHRAIVWCSSEVSMSGE